MADLDNPNPRETDIFLAQLGQMHQTMGLEKKYLDVMGPIFCSAIRKELLEEEAWDVETRNAWLHLFRIIVFKMKRGFKAFPGSSTAGNSVAGSRSGGTAGASHYGGMDAGDLAEEEDDIEGMVVVATCPHAASEMEEADMDADEGSGSGCGSGRESGSGASSGCGSFPVPPQCEF